MTTGGFFRFLFLTAIAALAMAPAASAEVRPAAPPIPAVQATQSDSFGIFRTPPESLPAAVAQLVAPSLEGDYPVDNGAAYSSSHGFNLALAQKAQPPGHRGALWVIPGAGYLMLLQIKGPRPVADTFAPTRKVIKKGIGFGRGSLGSPASGDKEPADHDEWVGLVPDGVVAVRLGKRTFAPVADNVYSVAGAFTDLWEHQVLIRRK